MNAPTANRTLSALGSFSDTAEPLTQLFAGMYDSVIVNTFLVSLTNIHARSEKAEVPKNSFL